jgi:site-specific DNA recombinase
MTKAAAYVRVSTSNQIDGESLSTQKSTIQAYCTLRNWELVNVYEDAGISGTKDNRPALQALLTAVKARGIDAVVVRDLSRFGRSARDLLNNIQTLKDCSVTFISLKEGIDGSGPYGQFMLTILAAIAELEGRNRAWRDAIIASVEAAHAEIVPVVAVMEYPPGKARRSSLSTPSPTPPT